MIVSSDDTLRKYYVFWITVGLMRGASKYELFYVRWICLLCVHDVDVYLCICFVLEALHELQVYLGLWCMYTKNTK